MGKPHDLTERAVAMLDQGIIDISGEVDAEMSDYVREGLLRLNTNGSPPITIKILSTGGFVRAGLKIYDTLLQYPGFKTGVIDGECNSMAAVILMACDKRQIMPSGSIHPHNVRIYTEGIDFELLIPEKRQRLPKHRIEEFEKDILDAQALQDLCDQAFMHGSGMKMEQVRELLGKDETLSAQQALEFGLVDEILQQPAKKTQP